MITRTTALALGLIFLAGSAAQSPALAEKVTALGQFNDWSAYSYRHDGKPRCYAFSRPTTMQPTRLNHGDVVLMLTAKPGRTTEANFQTGYNFKEGSVVVASIGDETFRLTTSGSDAWLRRADREAEFLKAVRGGRNVELSATSSRGNQTTYVVSLAGATAATDRIFSQCR
ncbi:invasion associated locus B family protein [Xanthobacteraceae bacterium A53D]